MAEKKASIEKILQYHPLATIIICIEKISKTIILSSQETTRLEDLTKKPKPNTHKWKLIPLLS